MPFVLNSQARLACCHQGPVTVMAKQMTVKVGGAPALCSGDVSGSPTTCPVPPVVATGVKPCTTSTVFPIPGVSVSAKVKIGGKPVMMGMPGAPLQGLTDSTPVPCPIVMVMSPGQTKVMVNG
jgi:hypothetical protein